MLQHKDMQERFVSFAKCSHRRRREGEMAQDQERGSKGSGAGLSFEDGANPQSVLSNG